MNCYYCGKILDTRRPVTGEKHFPDMATVDHLIPASRGGNKFSILNTVDACFGCNTDKGRLTLDEYRLVIAFRRGLVSRDAALGMRFWAEAR